MTLFVPVKKGVPSYREISHQNIFKFKNAFSLHSVAFKNSSLKMINFQSKHSLQDGFCECRLWMWLLHAASEQHGWSEKTSMWPCLLSWMYSTRLLSWWYWHKMSRMQVRSYWNIVCWMVYRLVNLTAVDNYNDLFRSNPYYIINVAICMLQISLQCHYKI